MSKNGPYPGQPWSAGGSSDSDEPYTAPADPWGEHAGSAVPPAHPQGGWGGHPTSMPPAMDSPLGYPTYGAVEPTSAPPQPWGQPVGPPPRKRNTPIIALVVVLGLLICGGLGTTAWLLNKRADPASNSGAQGATTATTATTAPAAAQAAPRSSSDARFVTKGQCVRNEGTAGKPDMKIAPCASGTYEVLKRIDGRTTGEADAESKCNKITGYTKWYFYDSGLDSLDFVLCLREHES